MTEQEVSNGREEVEDPQGSDDRHEGDRTEAVGDPAAAQGRTKRRTVRRRRSRNTRAVEIRIGKRRIGVDGWELSAGVLTYWIDDVHVLLPVTKKIEIKGQPDPSVYQGEVWAEAPKAMLRKVPDWMQPPSDEDRIAQVERAAAEFKARQRAELSAMMRAPQGAPDTDD